MEWLTAFLWVFFGILSQLKRREKIDLRFSLGNRTQHTDKSPMHTSRTGQQFFPCIPGKSQPCHHLLGGRMSRRKWSSCGPGSSHPPITLWPESWGTAGESLASWHPTGEKKQILRIRFLFFLLQQSTICRETLQTCSWRCTANGSWFWHPRLHAYCVSESL